MDLSTRDQDIAESQRLLADRLPNMLAIIFLTPIAMLFAPESGYWPEGSMWRYFAEWKWGLDGDPYWKAKYGSGVKDWWTRCLWVWRNANIWESEHGVNANNIVKLEYEGEPMVGNHPLVEGSLAIHAWDKDGKRFWAYYDVKKLSDTRCHRSYIGWKLQEVLHNFMKTGSYVGTGDPIMPAVYSVSSTMGYTL